MAQPGTNTVGNNTAAFENRNEDAGNKAGDGKKGRKPGDGKKDREAQFTKVIAQIESETVAEGAMAITIKEQLLAYGLKLHIGVRGYGWRNERTCLARSPRLLPMHRLLVLLHGTIGLHSYM